VIKTRQHFTFQIRLLLAALGLATLGSGCGGDVVLPDEGEAAALEIVSGDEQLGPAGAPLTQPLVVAVKDTRDRPVANHEVTFSIGSGGGSVEPVTVNTDTDGHASAVWTLGPNTGSQLLRVQTARGGSGALELTFRATAVAGSGSNLIGVSGDEQTGPVSSALADSLVVKATDALGNPVSGVEVTWSVAGGGSISPVTVVTGADGLAAAERVLGPTATAQSAQATVAGFTGSPVTFSHTAIPANPTALVKVSGDNQTGPAGFEVAQDLVVRLEDDNGNGIGGRPISWVVSSDAGSVNPTSATTDPNGLAMTRWTLPGTVGTRTNGVSAVFSGLDPVQFTATATADVPTTIELVSGNNQSAIVGSAVANPLVVRVTDASDNPVANVGVVWTAEGGGSVSDVNTATDASGLAQVTRTVGLVPGAYTTTAVAELNGSPITFTSTATVGPAAKLAIITQPAATGTSGQALSPQPEIEVQDALGNPVVQPVRTVSASITSSPEDPTGAGSATLLGASDQTNSNGRTTYTNLRITGPSGSYVLTFNSGALSPATSATITLGGGSAAKLVMQQQPSGTATSGAVIAQAPIVRVEDAAGNPVSGSRNVRVDIESGTGVLSGTTTVNTSGGLTATFDNLRITGTGSHTLVFSSSGLTSVESGTIDITAASTTTDLSAEPASSVVGEQVTFTASVTSGGGTPTGQVSFRDGGNEIGQGTLAAGVATFATTALTAGTHSITAHYLGNGAFGTSASSTLDYSVGAANVAPNAQDDAYSVDEDLTLTGNVLDNDMDPDGPEESLTAVVVGDGPSNEASFTLNPDGSFSYTPSPDFNGIDSFTYQASDGQANSTTATVTITVNEVNDPPGFVAGPPVEVSALLTPAEFTDDFWATGISPGPPDEIAQPQTVTFQVTLDDPADADAFQVPPAVAPDGTLSFTRNPLLIVIPRVIPVTVVAVDSETAASEARGFTITITP
jgi:hypothetical protein